MSIYNPSKNQQEESLTSRRHTSSEDVEALGSYAGDPKCGSMNTKDPMPMMNTPQPSQRGFELPTLEPRYETGIEHSTEAMSYAPAIRPARRGREVTIWLEVVLCSIRPHVQGHCTVHSTNSVYERQTPLGIHRKISY